MIHLYRIKLNRGAEIPAKGAEIPARRAEYLAPGNSGAKGENSGLLRKVRN
jgi:hypothetical protein